MCFPPRAKALLTVEENGAGNKALTDVAQDEPSTGMDPAARHFLWSILQHQVVAAGETRTTPPPPPPCQS